jgi:hypothetical protein
MLKRRSRFASAQTQLLPLGGEHTAVRTHESRWIEARPVAMWPDDPNAGTAVVHFNPETFLSGDDSSRQATV